ncbi:MAG: hypothetical protein Fur0040_01920 [Sideroxydans sp.]
MTAWLANVQARWQQLTAAEQRALRVGAVVLLPLLGWALLWQPAHEAVTRLQRSVPLLRAHAAAMAAQALEIQTLRQRAQLAVVSGEALRRIVADAAAPLGEVSVEMQGANTLRLAGERVPYAAWLHLLRELDETHHLRVSMLNLQAGTAPGLVKLDALLTNGVED